MMQILVWHGKHGDVYYSARDAADREASARKLLEQWLDPQYPWIPEPEDPMKFIQYSGIDLDQARLTDEQINELPTESLRKEAQKHKNGLRRRLSNYEANKEEYALAKRVAAGETVMEVRAEKSKCSEERWQRWLDIREDQMKRFPGTVYEEDRVLSPVTAWSLVQTYGDGEYMGVSVECVETNEED